MLSCEFCDIKNIYLKNTWERLLLDNSLNSISSSDYPDRQFNGILFSALHELRKSYPFRVIGYININYVRNKLEPLKETIKDNIDIL